MPMNLRIGRRTGFVIAGKAVGPTADSQAGKGGPMYVRMTTLSFRNDKYDEGLREFGESVVPAAKAQSGFRGIYLLADRRTARCVSLTFWEDEAAAVANEKNLYYQEQLVKLMRFFQSDPVRDGYELVIEAH